MAFQRRFLATGGCLLHAFTGTGGGGNTEVVVVVGEMVVEVGEVVGGGKIE